MGRDPEAKPVRLVAGGAPGSPSSDASITPPVTMSFIRFGFVWAILSTCSTAICGESAFVAIEPAKCPPGTDMPMLDARMRGPTSLPAPISSRTRASKSSTPPTVRMVVTPLMSSVRAKPATLRLAAALRSALDVSAW